MKVYPKKKKLIKEEDGGQERPGKQVIVRATSGLFHFPRGNYFASLHKDEAMLLVLCCF